MIYGMVMPRKYIQGDGILRQLHHYVGLCGKKPLLVWGNHSKQATQDAVYASLREHQVPFCEWAFHGESSKAEAELVQRLAIEEKADVIVGLGGGKVIDTAKGVAGWMGIPVIVCPTIVATDAPCTSTSGWYNEEGIMTEIYVAPFNPDILLVDTGVIARSPLRTFVAGMGDGITTYLEGRLAYASRTTVTNRASAIPTMAVRAIEELCYRTLLEDGEEAVSLVKRQVVTPLLDRVVEALVLHSGIGGESGGIAAAHSIANNLPYFKQNHAYFHGENVAFGVISQFMLDDAVSSAETQRVVDWMIRVGLPVTLDGIGLKGVTKDELDAFAAYCIDSPVSFFQSMSMPVTARQLSDAMWMADDYGRRRSALIR